MKFFEKKSFKSSQFNDLVLFSTQNLPNLFKNANFRWPVHLDPPMKANVLWIVSFFWHPPCHSNKISGELLSNGTQYDPKLIFIWVWSSWFTNKSFITSKFSSFPMKAIIPIEKRGSWNPLIKKFLIFPEKIQERGMFQEERRKLSYEDSFKWDYFGWRFLRNEEKTTISCQNLLFPSWPDQRGKRNSKRTTKYLPKKHLNTWCWWDVQRTWQLEAKTKYMK